MIVGLRGAVLPPDVACERHAWEAVEVDPRAMLDPNGWVVIVDGAERVRVVRAACLPVAGTVTLGALVGVRSPVPERTDSHEQ
jgi:hypothetical protein